LTYPFRFVSLWDMLELPSSEILHAYQGICTLIQMLQEKREKFQIAEVSAVDCDRDLMLLAEHAAALDLPLTLKSIREVNKIWAQGEHTGSTRAFSVIHAHELHSKMSQFTHRMRDEYTTRVFLAVPYGMAKFYSDPKTYFGDKAWSQFPAQGQFEMEEACRCFALARSTAAAFHLMRLMEVAIGAVRKCLGLPDPIKPAQRNWGVILKAIKDEIDARNAKGGPGWAKTLDRSFFDEAYLLLTAVKDTWRNSTMHVENKYNEEEVENILGTVRAFVRKLATRMDEDGQPKA
jgi:hypothetical protein